MSTKRPDPKRFQDYKEFADGTGFTIHERGKSIDFYYDEKKGWFDESDEDDEDELLKDYEDGLGYHSQHSDSYYDDDYDIDEPDPDDLEQIIREQPGIKPEPKNWRRQDDFQKETKDTAPLVKKAEEKKEPHKEEKKEAPKPKDDPKPKETPKKKEVPQVKQEQKVQEKHEVQKPQQVQQQQQSKPPQPQGPRVYVTGLPKKETGKDFEKWLQSKTKTAYWTDLIDRENGELRDVKILFSTPEDAEQLVNSLAKTQGKVPYKGKTSLTFQVKCD